MSRCPSCQKSNLPGRFTCTQCGASLQPASAAVEENLPPTLCSGCGLLNPPRAFFCDNCGNQLGVRDECS